MTAERTSSRSISPTITLTLLAIAGCAPLFPTGDSPRAPVSSRSPLSTEAIEAHIAYLASDELEGREAGTPGCEAAEKYIANAFETAGLDAVEFQPFEFVAGARLGDSNRLTIDGLALPDDAFRPLAYSSAAEGEWPAVFAGYGISAAKDLGHDDYAGLDVDGKVVVVLRGSPDGSNPHGDFADHATARAKALAAVHRGAKGLVVVLTGTPEEQEPPPFHGDSISRDVGLAVVAVKASACPDSLGIDVEAARKALDKHERVSRTLDSKIELAVDVSLERRTTRNVLGWLRARHPSAVDEVVIIGAHLDHLGRGISGTMARQRRGEIHNGADDNASGVAGLIELARDFAPRAAGLRRHLLFIALGAEEWGLIGSKYFKDHPILRIPAADEREESAPLTAVAMLNMDMIGRMKEKRLLVSGAATSTSWREVLETVRREGKHDLELSIDEEKEMLGSSDHISFYKLGIPVAFFFSGTHREYHTPDDDLYRVADDGSKDTLINLAGMSSELAFIADVAETVANREAPLPFVEGVELAPRMRFSVVLRLMPDYAAEVEGMRIAGVTPGGPAASAGLVDGDVIVRFGDTPVRSVRDYMVGLQKAKPGQAVEVEIEREGKRRKVEVLPQGR